MTSMIDRMARATARHSTGGEMWEDLPFVVQDQHINLAYLALRTMREPSPELLAFFKLGGGWTADTEMGARIQAEMVKAFEKEWRAMIDVLSGDYMARTPAPETQNPARTAG